jgi:steroid 5-alpha reductase family enzyme
MSPISRFLLSLLVILFSQHLVFGFAAWRRRNDFADIAWGLGFVVVGCFNWFLTPSPSPRGDLVLALVTLWGVRLMQHIGSRVASHGEDARYQAMRKGWGDHQAWNSYVKVFMLQGALLAVVSLPVIFGVSLASSPWRWTDLLGAALFLFGLAVETISDRQLARFVRTKKPGQIMQTGLWKYSRHPNYFGEILLWWALAVIVCATGAWIAAVGPLMITALILKVSGIPMIENRYAGNPDFERYKKRTSAFFLWFPKKGDDL